jgi:superfamily II DNA or RNA helicase
VLQCGKINICTTRPETNVIAMSQFAAQANQSAGRSAMIDAPEVGQIVAVRNLRFVVANVNRGSLPSGPLAEGLNRGQHLVTLTSIEDDALGEELQVIWEVEPGARILDNASLPDLSGFDTPARLDAFLDAVRWGAASSADVRSLWAPFRSGVDIKDYQLDPLVRAIQMPRVNLLIADDVGFGKTVEAGLVLQEMLIRHRARRVLIVCPSALQIHWRDQMREKFGLEFRIVDSDLLKQLRRERGLHVNPWSHFPRLITSIDFVKRDRPMRLLRELLPAKGESVYPRHIDMLIVDEAHNVAPAGHGRYAVDSLRTQAIRTLTPHCEHRLFLTATPHNGYQESFTALLEMIDNQRFARGVEPDEAQKRAIMVRRMKQELVGWDGQPIFPARVLRTLEVEYTDEERQAHRWLQEYTRLRRRHLNNEHSDPALPGGDGDDGDDANSVRTQQYAAEFVLKLLKKRMFSSPAAFAATLEQHRRTVTAGRSAAAAAPVRPPSPGILRQMISRVEEDYAEDDVAEEATLDAVESASRLWPTLTAAESGLLDQLSTWANSAAQRPDSKARRLIEWVAATVRPGGVWSDERVIIFTEYRATRKWLQTLLAAAGLAGQERLLLLYSGMPTIDRECIKAAFLADPKQSHVRILLATDAASEGIDLQRHCHQLVHVEIPWNPNRLEQRNGRIDRYGQAHTPLIYHFVGKGYAERSRAVRSSAADLAPSELEADLEFLARVVEKVEKMREDLGTVGEVIADCVAAAMLGGRRVLDTDPAEQRLDPVRRQLKFERNLREQIDRLSQQLAESRRNLRMAPENIKAVVDVALQLAGQPALQPAQDATHNPAQPAAAPIHLWRMPLLSGSWQRALDGLRHPHTHAVRPITFDHAVASGRDDVVLVHLNHPLVQMSMRLLRAEVWANHERRGLQRATARIVPSYLLDTPAAVAHARLVIIGGDSQRLHEELISAGGEIREGRFRRMNIGQVRDLLTAASDHPAGSALQQQLLQLWPTLRPALVQALEVRGAERAQSLQT